MSENHVKTTVVFGFWIKELAGIAPALGDYTVSAFEEKPRERVPRHRLYPDVNPGGSIQRRPHRDRGPQVEVADFVSYIFVTLYGFFKDSEDIVLRQSSINSNIFEGPKQPVNMLMPSERLTVKCPKRFEYRSAKYISEIVRINFELAVRNPLTI